MLYSNDIQETPAPYNTSDDMTVHYKADLKAKREFTDKCDSLNIMPTAALIAIIQQVTWDCNAEPLFDKARRRARVLRNTTPTVMTAINLPPTLYVDLTSLAQDLAVSIDRLLNILMTSWTASNSTSPFYGLRAA